MKGFGELEERAEVLGVIHRKIGGDSRFQTCDLDGENEFVKPATCYQMSLMEFALASRAPQVESDLHQVGEIVNREQQELSLWSSTKFAANRRALYQGSNYYAMRGIAAGNRMLNLRSRTMLAKDEALV